MNLSQDQRGSPSKINPHTKTFRKIHQQIKAKEQQLNQAKRLNFNQSHNMSHKIQSSTGKNLYGTGTIKYATGNINFHELLSLPLQKEIHKENSLKQNKTFSLKFEPLTSQKQQSSRFKFSKQSFKQLKYNNLRISNMRNIETSASKRQRKLSAQDGFYMQMQDKSATMYFKPFRKIANNSENVNFQRKSLQFAKENSWFGSKQQLSPRNSKDKLLMLLQLRKRSQDQTENSAITSLSFYGKKYEKYAQRKQNGSGTVRLNQDRSYSFRQSRNKKYSQQIKQVNLKKMSKNKETKDQSNALSPWYLKQNAEEFQ